MVMMMMMMMMMIYDDDDDDDDKDEWMTIGSCKKDHLRRCIRLINATWS